MMCLYYKTTKVIVNDYFNIVIIGFTYHTSDFTYVAEQAKNKLAVMIIDQERPRDFYGEDEFIDKLWEVHRSAEKSERLGLYLIDQPLLNFTAEAYKHLRKTKERYLGSLNPFFVSIKKINPISKLIFFHIY